MNNTRKADANYEEDDGEYSRPPHKRRKGNEGDDASYSEGEDDDMYDEQDIDNAYDIDNAPTIEHRHEEEPAPPPPPPVTTPVAPARKNKKRKKDEEAAAKEEAAALEKLNKNRYHCNYCRKDITECVRIKCSVCTDFDLCVECFSVGVEITPHKNFHEYQVMDNMHFPLFDEAWGADEEILLLEAIEMYGLGNWNDVSDHVGTKNWLECKNHYFDTYINVPSAPLPDLSKVLTTQAMVQQLNKKSREGKSERAAISNKTIPKLVVPPTPSNNELHCALVDNLGYMKNRNEFETEYENDAELVIRDITFDDDDEPNDKELKQKVLELYNKKLDERVRLRKFILDNNLLDYKRIQQHDRRRPKEDRDLYNKMRVFLQVLPRKEYDELLVGLVKERQLRRRIEVLQNWRKQGVKTVAEGELFEVENQRRSNTQKRAKEAGNYYDKPGARAGTTRRERYIARERDESTLARLDKLKSRPRKPGQPLDLEGQPGVELLSVRERQVCSTVRILPKQYMVIKDTLLAEYAKCGHLNKTVARALVKIDVNKTARLFEFFEQSGWINRPNNLPPPDATGTISPLPPPHPSQYNNNPHHPSHSSLSSSSLSSSSGQGGNLIVSTQPQVVVQQGFQPSLLAAK